MRVAYQAAGETGDYSNREVAGCDVENTSNVILRWGKYAGHDVTPGIHCSNPCGRQILTISTKQISHDLRDVKVIDLRGNPLIISGVVRYYWANTVQTLLECETPSLYVEMIATAVLKQVVSRYPYESHDGSHCLKTESAVISRELVDELQQRVSASGAKIIGLSLNEISYAPEISNVMLKKQQASALVDARSVIVQGAVDVATEATDELAALGHNMSEKGKARTVCNLLTILCSERDVHPVIVME